MTDLQTQILFMTTRFAFCGTVIADADHDDDVSDVIVVDVKKKTRKDSDVSLRSNKSLPKRTNSKKKASFVEITLKDMIDSIKSNDSSFSGGKTCNRTFRSRFILPSSAVQRLRICKAEL